MNPTQSIVYDNNNTPRKSISRKISSGEKWEGKSTIAETFPEKFNPATPTEY